MPPHPNRAACQVHCLTTCKILYPPHIGRPAVWQKLPLFNAGAVRDCLTSIEFQAPIYISVSNVDRGNFRRLKVDYTTAIEMIAQVSEPCVTLVDASRQVVALFPQEYAVLVLRGTVDDWPTG